MLNQLPSETPIQKKDKSTSDASKAEVKDAKNDEKNEDKKDEKKTKK